MPLVVIHAQAPWGPISLRTAGGIGEVLVHGVPPAAVVEVGERDPAEVVREALRLLPPPMDASGLIPATDEKARNSVAEVVSRVLARIVAGDRAYAAPGQPESRGGPIAFEAEAETGMREQYADAPVRKPAPMTTNDDIRPVRRRPGAEVDAKAIRVGLGMSQPEFSGAYGIPLATLRDWEQGRRSPDGAGRSLLLVIERFPVRVRHALEGYGDAVGP